MGDAEEPPKFLCGECIIGYLKKSDHFATLK